MTGTHKRMKNCELYISLVGGGGWRSGKGERAGGKGHKKGVSIKSTILSSAQGNADDRETPTSGLPHYPVL